MANSQSFARSKCKRKGRDGTGQARATRTDTMRAISVKVEDTRDKVLVRFLCSFFFLEDFCFFLLIFNISTSTRRRLLGHHQLVVRNIPRRRLRHTTTVPCSWWHEFKTALSGSGTGPDTDRECECRATDNEIHLKLATVQSDQSLPNFE